MGFPVPKIAEEEEEQGSIEVAVADDETRGGVSAGGERGIEVGSEEAE